MDAENRDWGRPSPADLVPVVGVIYRLYWTAIAWRADGSAPGDWTTALRRERYRLLVTCVVTASALLFVGLGADRAAARPAVLVLLVGAFLHKVAATLGAGAAGDR